MIPIYLKPEPEGFDNDIRKEGQHKISAHRSQDKTMDAYWKKSSSNLWRRYSDDLYRAYDGICAYYCFYLDKSSGAVTTDHFKPKVLYPDLAYEWNNYRLSCLQANRRKGSSEDIFDPFSLSSEVNKFVFRIEFLTGSVLINTTISQQEQEKAQRTINILKLNDPNLCEMRLQHWMDYINEKVSRDYLKAKNPFVWQEVERQHVLYKEQNE